MGYDQPDNAYRLEKLGAGTSLAMKRVTGPNLVAKLRQVLQPDVRPRCRQWADRLAAERPLQETCQWIEQLAAQARR
jgi:UDP:flavonoid glycosyltransferase YjiC (YdhE family)